MFNKAFIVGFVIAFILLSRLFPIYYSIINTPTGFVYSGQTSAYDPDDINAYVAAINYGQGGNILLKNLYTTEDNDGVLIYPIYTIIGFLFRQADPYFLFQFITVITDVALCLVIFALSYKVLGNFWYSTLSMFLVTRGGGFGWFMAEKIRAADLMYTGITFSSTLQRAHEGLGTLIFILAMIAQLYFIKEKRGIFGIISFLAMALLVVLYPYYLINYFLVSGIFAVYFFLRNEDRKFLKILFLKILSIGVLATIYYLSLSSSEFTSAMQENIPKIGIFSLAAGYGVFIFLFIYLRFVKIKNSKRFEKYFLIVWILTSVILAYSPISYSRLFLRGLFFPLVLLSLILIINIISKNQRRLVLTIFCAFIPITSIYIFFHRIDLAKKQDNSVYISEQTMELLDFLSEKKRDGVLSYYRLGNFIPAKSGKSVYFGHWTQSPDSDKRQVEVIKFYSGRFTEEEAKKFLMENNISFVVYGPEERILGGYVYAFLKLLFSNSRIQLYSL